MKKKQREREEKEKKMLYMKTIEVVDNNGNDEVVFLEKAICHFFAMF